MKKRNCSKTTRNARLAAIKTFFFYLGREIPQCLETSRKINAIPQKKIPHKTVNYLDTEELDVIFQCIDVNSRNGLRDKALLLFMYNTGARVQEVVDVKLSDLRLDSSF